MNTPQRFLLPFLAAGTMSISSCVIPVDPYGSYYGPASTVGVVGVGYYNTLPSYWNQPYYYYGSRYYYGGRCETGHYNYGGHYYNNRYYHNGHYFYGGRYCEPNHHYSTTRNIHSQDYNHHH